MPMRAVIALAIVLVVTGVATATYLIVHSRAAGAPEAPGVLTLAGGEPNGPSKIFEVTPSGRLRLVWHCPENAFCGMLTSVAWSPDGKRLAMTLDEIGGRSGYVGMHIVDLRNGADLHIPSLPIPRIWRSQPAGVVAALWKQAGKRLGCGAPSDVAWSRDGKRLAYVCAGGPAASEALAASTIYVIRADGTGRVRVATRTRTAFSPTWSPDGKQLAFATEPIPHTLTGQGAAKRTLHSSVYVVALDGTARRRIATDAAAPSWSPDGTSIAYESACGGIRLVTPEGSDVTPGPGSACPHLGLRGVPAWSPDGSLLAIGTPTLTYLVAADGSGFRPATASSSAAKLAGGRPAWAPGNAAAKLRSRLHRGGV